MIAQPVQPRSIDTGAAAAVITVAVLVIQLPAALRGRRAKPVKVLLDTLRLSLTRQQLIGLDHRERSSAVEAGGQPGRRPGPPLGPPATAGRAISLLAYAFLAVTAARQRAADIGASALDLVPVTVPELLRQLRGTVILEPRRDKRLVAMATPPPVWRPASPPAMTCLRRRDATVSNDLQLP